MIFTVINEQEKLLPFFITGIGIQKSQEPIERPEGFPDYQWLICTKGKGILEIGNKSYTINQGDGFFFSPKIPHSYSPLEEPWETYWVIFNGAYIQQLLSALSLKPWEIFTPFEPVKNLELHAKIYHELSSDDFDKIPQTTPYLYELLMLLRSQSKRLTPTINKLSAVETLRPVISYMELNYSQDLTLEMLAQVIHVTTHHLCKLFKKAFAISPIHYLIRIRLQMAKQYLIQYPTLPLHTISQMVCYNDTSYFCCIFKNQEHMTPTQFRRLHGIG